MNTPPALTTFADHIIAYNSSLKAVKRLPTGIRMMQPFGDEVLLKLSVEFYRKFYNDPFQRTIILGINPGRFGAGITGVPFTDPIRLSAACGISSTLPPKPELSSVFVYEMIAQYGGVERFYRDFYISSVCPLGLVQDGKNLNYYDHPLLLQKLRTYILRHLRQQLLFPIQKIVCICWGEGTNFRYLQQLNTSGHFWKDIIALPHPRFIMQYKRKQKEDYIKRYIAVLSHCSASL